MLSNKGLTGLKAELKDDLLDAVSFIIWTRALAVLAVIKSLLGGNRVF